MKLNLINGERRALATSCVNNANYKEIPPQPNRNNVREESLADEREEWREEKEGVYVCLTLCNIDASNSTKRFLSQIGKSGDWLI